MPDDERDWAAQLEECIDRFGADAVMRRAVERGGNPWELPVGLIGDRPIGGSGLSLFGAAGVLAAMQAGSVIGASREIGRFGDREIVLTAPDY